MTDYIASFESDAGRFHVLAARWDAGRAAHLPSAWMEAVRQAGNVNVALRRSGGPEPASLVIMTSPAREVLARLGEQLCDALGADAPATPGDATAFDTWVAPPTPFQLRVNHEGYSRGGHPLGCDFHLFRDCLDADLAMHCGYQAALLPLEATPERLREVRKYLAWLEIERPFPAAVRGLQHALASRLLGPAWLIDEFMYFATPALRDHWQQRIATAFDAVAGRLGFGEAPIESGDFSDWLSTGVHATPAALRGGASTLGARVVTGDELSGLLERWRRGRRPQDDSDDAGIFISHASPDADRARALCAAIERLGHRCWIAPRDINLAALPYTEAIADAIRRARAVVVLLSPETQQSVHVPRELDLALAGRLSIIPLRLHPIEPQGQLDYLLRTCQWLDAFDRSWGEVLSELDTRLRKLGAGREPKPC